jgi:hypothetical protein
MRLLRSTSARRCISAAALLLLILLFTNVEARKNNLPSNLNANDSYEFSLDGLSWKAIPVDCQKGDHLSGHFIVSCDGSLFPGDEKKYDNWILEGVQFFIVDNSNFVLLEEREEFHAEYSVSNAIEITWTFDVQNEGKWFIVYFNDSIYMKTIVGTINRATNDETSYLLIILVLTGMTVAATLGFIRKMKS